jgi:ESF2/ABP1 family protein
MATRKINDYLDADDSNDEGSQGYDSEIEDLKKGGRSPKRRKVESHGIEDEEHEEHEEFENGASNEQDEALNPTEKTVPVTPGAGTSLELSDVLKPLTKKNLVSTQAAIKRSGVVYLSRIPPFMKPTKLRSLLEPYGAIGRIFMTPEDPASHTRRVRNGGNKKVPFILIPNCYNFL